VRSNAKRSEQSWRRSSTSSQARTQKQHLADRLITRPTAQAVARRRLALTGRATALASSRMPTRTLPHGPIPVPQSVQVTRLSSVAWSGTTNLLLPHLRHLRGQVCVSALIGSGMTLRPFWSVELPQERSG